MDDLMAALNDRDSRIAVETERRFLEELGGGCRTPAGAYAWTEAGFGEPVGVLCPPPTPAGCSVQPFPARLTNPKPWPAKLTGSSWTRAPPTWWTTTEVQ